MKTDLQILKYIDTAIERQRAISNKDMDVKIDLAIERERGIFNKDMDAKFEHEHAMFSKEMDVKIEHERKIFDKNTQHFMTIQREILQDDIKKIAEMVNDKPSREEVREIVREEIAVELRPIKTELSMFREELLDHREKIDALYC